MKRQLIWLAAAAFAALSLSISTPSMADDTMVESDAAQIARGARLWSQDCTRCHNLRAPGDMSDDEARLTMMHMRIAGDIPGDEARAILAFLQASNN